MTGCQPLRYTASFASWRAWSAWSFTLRKPCARHHERRPALRLGLMMLDSAAELLLHRECDSRLQWAEQSYRERCAWPRRCASNRQGTRMVTGLQEKALPAAQCRQIDRDFGAKCDYLVGLGVLAEPHARALKKLHRYRDEAYHRDRFCADCGAPRARCPSRGKPISCGIRQHKDRLLPLRAGVVMRCSKMPGKIAADVTPGSSGARPVCCVRRLVSLAVLVDAMPGSGGSC